MWPFCVAIKTFSIGDQTSWDMVRICRGIWRLLFVATSTMLVVPSSGKLLFTESVPSFVRYCNQQDNRKFLFRFVLLVLD
jgi:hypothetical protein